MWPYALCNERRQLRLLALVRRNVAQECRENEHWAPTSNINHHPWSDISVRYLLVVAVLIARPSGLFHCAWSTWTVLTQGL